MPPETLSYEAFVSHLADREYFGQKLGLERIQSLLERLGNPHHRFRSIHIAGTNGKGSTAAMIASILSEAGYRVGLYTSPHLVDFCERIQIWGTGGEGRAPATRAIHEHGSGRNPSQDPLLKENLCASFQETVVDHLIDKSIAAAKNRRCKAILLTGGVACNSRLKEKLAAVCEEKGLKLFYPSPVYCTDNAAMIAYTGGRYLLKGIASPLNLNARANLDLKSPLGPS